MNYFLTLMFLNKKWKEDELGGYRNNHRIGYWKTYDEAYNYLMKHWFCLHEHWVDTAVIEEIPYGSASAACWNHKNWWFHTEDMLEIKPTILKEPPKQVCMNNDGKAIMFGP